MTIEKQTVPYCLNVIWDENGNLKGAAYYEQDVIRDDGVIISAKQGDAQPVAVLDHKGVDVTGIIGRIGQDAIALAESKDVELRAALADVCAARWPGPSRERMLAIALADRVMVHAVKDDH